VNRSAATLLDTSLVAAIHRVGGRYLVVIASVTGTRPSIRETVEFAEDLESQLVELDGLANVGTVLWILPGSRTICRTCMLPETDQETMEGALRLQAESMLLESAPAHRVGMAVIPAAPGETTRTGVVVHWPEEASCPTPAITGPVRFTPEIAALAALMDRSRPADPLLCADRSTGSVALLMTQAGDVSMRCTTERAESSDEWAGDLARVLGETALAAGHSPAFVRSVRDKLGPALRENHVQSIPEEIIAQLGSRLGGAEISSANLTRFAVPLGAILARAGALAALTELRAAPELIHPTLVQRTKARMSQKSSAIRLVVAALIVLAFSPALLAGSRLLALRMRHGDVSAHREALTEAKTRLELYRTLQDESWSMTKILSDVVCAAPPGIDLTTLRITSGESGFAIRGEARPHSGRSAQQLVAAMAENIGRSGIFEPADFAWDPPNNNGILEFDLRAKVKLPHRDAPYASEQDFGAWTLADRNAGIPAPVGKPATPQTPEVVSAAPPKANGDSGASPPTGQSNAKPPDTTLVDGSPGANSQPPTNGIARPRPEGPGGEGGGGNLGEQKDRELMGETDSTTIPPALTDEQIKSMTRADCIAALTKISEIRKRIGSSEKEKELTDRLIAEHRRIMDHLKLIPADSGGAGAGIGSSR